MDNWAGMQLEVLPRAELSVGFKLTFRISAKQPGYLTLVDVDSEGKSSQSHANLYSAQDSHGSADYDNFLRRVPVLYCTDELDRGRDR
jgi:hypothetical protein